MKVFCKKHYQAYEATEGCLDCENNKTVTISNPYYTPGGEKLPFTPNLVTRTTKNIEAFDNLENFSIEYLHKSKEEIVHFINKRLPGLIVGNDSAFRRDLLFFVFDKFGNHTLKYNDKDNSLDILFSRNKTDYKISITFRN